MINKKIKPEDFLDIQELSALECFNLKGGKDEIVLKKGFKKRDHIKY